MSMTRDFGPSGLAPRGQPFQAKGALAKGFAERGQTAPGIIAILIGLVLPGYQRGDPVEWTDSRPLPNGGATVQMVLAGAVPGRHGLLGRARLTIEHPRGLGVVELSLATRGRRVMRLGDLLPAAPGTTKVSGAFWHGPASGFESIEDLGTIRMGDGSVRPTRLPVLTRVGGETEVLIGLLLPAVQRVREAASRSHGTATPLDGILAEGVDAGAPSLQLFALVVS